MQTTCDPGFITATFIKELKNRFLCEVEIDGEHVVCYVPASCHLSNFLKLEGRKVLLVPTKSKDSRTPYALLAVPYKRSYIVLNSSMANRAIENSIHSRHFSDFGKRKTVLKEHYVDGYKSDIFIKEVNTIIEVKSVLSTSEIAEFPTVYSERSLKQLEKLFCLIDKGYKVHYCILSLNPYVHTIHIVPNGQFAELFIRCIRKGMTVSGFTCKFKPLDKITVKNRLIIKLEEDNETY